MLTTNHHVGLPLSNQFYMSNFITRKMRQKSQQRVKLTLASEYKRDWKDIITAAMLLKIKIFDGKRYVSDPDQMKRFLISHLYCQIKQFLVMSVHCLDIELNNIPKDN